MKRDTEITLMLPCPFSQDEHDAKLKRLFAASKAEDEIEAKKATSSKAFNDALRAAKSEQKHLFRVLERNSEDRNIKCLIRYHSPNVGEKTTVRLDTGEVVKQEPMTDDERQENLFEEIEGLEKMYDAPDARTDETPGNDAPPDGSVQ